MITDFADVRLLSKLMPGNTLTSTLSQHAMLDALRHVDSQNVDGDVVECGVWRGGNLLLARVIVPGRRCWGYDTFSGMTEPGPEDTKRSGSRAIDRLHEQKRNGVPWCAAALEDVRALLLEAGVLDENLCRFVVGDVCRTLLDPRNLPESIAVLHLDTDWYASTRVELEVLYPRLTPGGVLIVDDYLHWQGSKKAVDEFFANDPEFRVDRIDQSAVGYVKPAVR